MLLSSSSSSLLSSSFYLVSFDPVERTADEDGSFDAEEGDDPGAHQTRDFLQVSIPLAEHVVPENHVRNFLRSELTFSNLTLLILLLHY